MNIIVVAPKVPKNIKDFIKEDSVVYACDEAVSELVKHHIHIDLAIGDFDSLKDTSILKNIKTIKLSKDKDDSDTHYAIRHAYDKTDNVILVGGLEGSRIDHLVANLLLLEKFPTLVIYNDTNKISRLEEGMYKIKKDKYTYLSLFPLLNTKVSLSGTRYELKEHDLFMYDTIGLSNEIMQNECVLYVHEGVILIIQSR